VKQEWAGGWMDDYYAWFPEDDKPFRAIGQDVTIYPSARISDPSRVTIGNNSIVNDFCFLHGDIRIADFVHLATGANLDGQIEIGDFVGISGGVNIYAANDDYWGNALANPTVPADFRKVDRRLVILEKHVMVGAGSVILPGVVIHEGAVIGALSLVKHNVPAWEVWAGCPNHFIGYRRRDKILEMEVILRKMCYEDGVYLRKNEWKIGGRSWTDLIAEVQREERHI
jgi:acetyltransferase-like isoleucine patch superfamily enzyme